jgi:hypothetical protein
MSTFGGPRNEFMIGSEQRHKESAGQCRPYSRRRDTDLKHDTFEIVALSFGGVFLLTAVFLLTQHGASRAVDGFIALSCILIIVSSVQRMLRQRNRNA